MNAKHTPGPWVIESLPDDGPSIHTAGYGIARRIAGVSEGGWTRTSKAEAMANARLIAAAPDLLAALLNLIITMCAADGSDIEADLDTIDARMDEARAVIAKATGESA